MPAVINDVGVERVAELARIISTACDRHGFAEIPLALVCQYLGVPVNTREAREKLNPFAVLYRIQYEIVIEQPAAIVRFHRKEK